MSAQCEVTAKVAAKAPISTFERYLTVWVFLCIVAGIGLGQLLPDVFQSIGRMEIANGSKHRIHVGPLTRAGLVEIEQVRKAGLPEFFATRLEEGR